MSKITLEQNLITESLQKTMLDQKKKLLGPRSSKLSQDSVSEILNLMKKNMNLKNSEKLYLYLHFSSREAVRHGAATGTCQFPYMIKKLN